MGPHTNETSRILSAPLDEASWAPIATLLPSAATCEASRVWSPDLRAQGHQRLVSWGGCSTKLFRAFIGSQFRLEGLRSMVWEGMGPEPVQGQVVTEGWIEACESEAGLKKCIKTRN